MPKVIRDGGYIAAKRKKALTHTILWCLMMLVVFLMGMFFNGGSRTSFFTVIAAVMSLPVAQNLVTAISYTTKAKSTPEYDKKVLSLPQGCVVFVNNIAVTGKSSIPVNYIIGSGNKIYVLVDYTLFNMGILENMRALWIKKGIDADVRFYNVTQWDAALEELGAATETSVDDFYISAIEKLLL